MPFYPIISEVRLRQEVIAVIAVERAVTAAPRVSHRRSGGAVNSDLFGDTPPAAPANASAAAWRQDLLWGKSNDGVTVMVPLLPFRLVLLGVQSSPPPSPSASSSPSSSSIFDPLVEYLESAWAAAIASDGAYGGRFRGERGCRCHPPPTDDAHVVCGGTESCSSASSSSSSSSSTTATTVVVNLGRADP